MNTISFTPTQKTASSTGDWLSGILLLLQGVVVILMGSRAQTLLIEQPVLMVMTMLLHCRSFKEKLFFKKESNP